MSVVFGVALLGTTGANPPAPADPTGALKPISQVALQNLVAATARELLIPGALVLLRTPQGEFTATYGTTKLGTASPPAADTYFRIASNTKTMTAAVIVQLAQEGKLKFGDPVSDYVADVPNGDHITIAELLECERPLQLPRRLGDRGNRRPRYDQSLDSGRVAGDSLCAQTQLCTWHGLRIQQHQLHPAWPHHREDYRHDFGRGNAGIDIRAARLAAHLVASKRRNRTTRTVLPRIHVRQFLRRLHGDAADSPAHKAAARAGTLLPTDYTNLNTTFGWAAGAPSLTPTIAQPGSKHWSPAACSTRSISGLAQQPAARGSEEARRLRVRVRHHKNTLGKGPHRLSRRRDGRL